MHRTEPTKGLTFDPNPDCKNCDGTGEIVVLCPILDETGKQIDTRTFTCNCYCRNAGNPRRRDADTHAKI